MISRATAIHFVAGHARPDGGDRLLLRRRAQLVYIRSSFGGILPVTKTRVKSLLYSPPLAPQSTRTKSLSPIFWFVGRACGNAGRGPPR